MKKIIIILFAISFSHLSFSQESEILTIKNDSSEIFLESLNIEVVVIGNIANTVTKMTFFNPNDRILEGELNFPLGEGQSVYRFAMDVNGKLREGVAVEKNLGRKTYEGVVRQTIDPGLLEMTAGNNYKARVYPIPANGRKSILIGYEEEINNEDAPIYQLVMDYGHVKEFSLNVKVLQQEIEPRFKQNEITNFSFSKWQNSFIASHAAYNFDASGIISFEIPQEIKEQVFIGKSKGKIYFYLNLMPEFHTIEKELPTSVGIFWDASKSGLSRDLAKELQLIDQYFKKFDDVSITVIRYSNKIIDKADFMVNKGNSDELRQYLSNTIYDGGTNLELLKFDQLDYDELFLFTDGISNLGNLDIESSSTPVNTISSNKSSNYAMMQFLAEMSGGDFINLLNTTIENAIVSLFTDNYQFLHADHDVRRIDEVYPNKPTTIKEGNLFSISGILHSKKAPSIHLHFGAAGKVLHSRKVKLNVKANSESIARLWANKKIQSLMSHPKENKAQIINVGKEHSLVTSYTSLIILDRVEDYVQYEIIPPPELLEEYNSMLADKVEEKVSTKEELIEITLAEFEDRKDWWIENKKDDQIYVHKKKDSTNVSQTIQVPPTTTAINEPAVEDTTSRSIVNQPETFRQTDTLDSNPTPVDTTVFNKIIEGFIRDKNGDPIPGVNVFIKGASIGTISDIEGRYKLRVRENDVLVINFIGYKTEEYAVTDEEVKNILLAEEVMHLSEVVVTALGVQRESRALGYSVQTIGRALAGSVPGVEIENNSGNQVVIRGNSSVEVGAKPLYVIDGEIVDEEEFGWLGPDEIASMNVIKSEDAASIYGSRASDGVIVIMTKSGLEDEIVLPDSITSKFDQNLVIDEWKPDEPYIDSLEKTPENDRYNAYLKLREVYGKAPSFYLACGVYFIDAQQEEIGWRILSNIAELEMENHELLKILAHKYQQLGAVETSILLYQKIVELRDDEPQSKRDLALAYVDLGDYQKALNLFNEIITHEWDNLDDRFPLFKSTVLHEMNNLIALHKDSLDLSEINAELIHPMPVDLRIVLDWNMLETDLDLWVTEPGGEKCFYSNQLTVLGGRLTEDYMDGYGPEEYLLKNAVQGEYKIEVNYYDERVQKISGPVILQVTVFKHYGTKYQTVEEFTLKLEGAEDTIEVGKIVWDE